MRSNVVDSARLPKVDVRHSGYEPAFRSQQPLRGRPASKPTLRPAPRRLALAPTEGWSPLLLLAIAIYSVVWSIIAAAWVSHSMVLLWCPAVGLIVGLLVAKLDKLPQTILHIVACLLGHWLSIWLTSVVAFHISWLVLLGSLRMVLTTGMNQAVMPSSDMVFFFYLAFLSFFLGYFGCWLIYRARLPWLVALVYCSIMLVNLNSYGGQDLSFLLITLLGSLMLLIARVQLTNQITRWKRDGLHTDSSWLRGITWRCMQVAGVLTLLALLLSWLLPIQDQSSAGKLFWDSVNTTWTDVLHPGSVNSASGTSTNFFGDSLTISGSAHLPIGDVLYYTSSTGKPYYLEGFTYDRFDGHTWSTSFDTAYAQAFPANALLQLDILRNDYSRVTTNVTVVLPPEGAKHYLFGPAQPTQFDVATYIYSNPTAIVWTQQSALANGERYQVVSSMPTTDQRTLSSVPLPTNNPDLWNADNNAEMLVTYYQQVPHDLSPNVSSVAKEWTRGATSAYEALKMLESHLSDQNNFTYSVDNPAIPGNVDVVDWLLQNRRGFCTYYASAMVLMARLLGIPARMVNGFSQGHFDAKRKVWVVQGDDAHSWVQAYLPGFGWISFDPTPGFSLRAAPQPMPSPTATRPPTKPHATVTPPVKSTVQPKPRPTVGSHPSSPTTASTVSGVGGNDTALVEISIIALVCSLLLFFVALARYWWRNLFANSTVISGIFWRLCYVASWIGFSPHRWQTPYEYSRMLSHHLPEQAHPLWLLTELFVRDRWAPPQQVPQVHEEAYAQHLWSNLHGIVMRLALKKIKK